MKPRVIVEVGVDYGYSLMKWAEWFPNAEITGIDSYVYGDAEKSEPCCRELIRQWKQDQDRAFNSQMDNLLETQGSVELWKMDSFEAWRKWTETSPFRHKKIDILHIDADHSYEGVKKDYELWGPLGNEGGCILFHNVGGSFIDSVGKYFREVTTGMERGTQFDFNSMDHNGIGVIYKGGKQ
jgi:predicted O-methyltransferase YrrM